MQWTTAQYQDIAEYYDIPDLYVAFNRYFHEPFTKVRVVHIHPNGHFL